MLAKLLDIQPTGTNLHSPVCLTLQVDDTYMQLKKDLEYLDLKVRDPDLLFYLCSAPLMCSDMPAHL